MEAGYPVHLANTTAIKQYDGLKHRGDESDARHLAHILRLGLLPEGHIIPKPLRAVRDLARKRMQLVQQRTMQVISIETCLAQQTGGRLGKHGPWINEVRLFRQRQSPVLARIASRLYCHDGALSE